MAPRGWLLLVFVLAASLSACANAYVAGDVGGDRPDVTGSSSR